MDGKTSGVRTEVVCVWGGERKNRVDLIKKHGSYFEYGKCV